MPGGACLLSLCSRASCLVWLVPLMIIFSLISTMPSAKLLPVVVTDVLCLSIMARWRSQIVFLVESADESKGRGALELVGDLAAPSASDTTRSSAVFAFLLKWLDLNLNKFFKKWNSYQGDVKLIFYFSIFYHICYYICILFLLYFIQIIFKLYSNYI